jgi:hypothetical protein
MAIDGKAQVTTEGAIQMSNKMRKKADLPVKTCAGCGRPFTWRKKWARDWGNVRYCSKACAGGKVPPRGGTSA